MKLFDVLFFLWLATFFIAVCIYGEWQDARRQADSLNSQLHKLAVTCAGAPK